MDFVGGSTTIRMVHNYLFVLVDMFNDMCFLMPCKNTIKEQEETNMFFELVWMNFGIPQRIILEKDTKFIRSFWTTLWEKMDTKLKRYKKFHP
jgi:hypothetical protein